MAQIPARSGVLDGRARRGFMNFYSNLTGEAYWTVPCTHLVKSVGKNPSYAMAGIAISSADFSKILDDVVCLSLQTGPATATKLLVRGTAWYADSFGVFPIVNGWYVWDGHRGNEDSIVYYIADDRHIMSSYYTLFGKMVYNPYTGAHYFLSNPSDPLVFNANGWGDCLDMPGVGPRFAPGYRYGHSQTGTYDPTTDPGIGAASNTTRRWTVVDIIRYIHDFTGYGNKRPGQMSGGNKSVAGGATGFGLMDLPPKYLDWPETLGSNIIANRTPLNFRLDGKDVLSGLMLALSYAGPYTLALEPIDQIKNIMKILDMSVKNKTDGSISDQGAKVYHPLYYGKAGIELCADNPNVAQDWSIKRSAAGFAPKVGLAGDADSIELMASTFPNDSDCSDGGGADFTDFANSWSNMQGVLGGGGEPEDAGAAVATSLGLNGPRNPAPTSIFFSGETGLTPGMGGGE